MKSKMQRLLQYLIIILTTIVWTFSHPHSCFSTCVCFSLKHLKLYSCLLSALIAHSLIK